MINKKWSLNIGKIAGARIYIHWTFLVLALWMLILNIYNGNDFSHLMYVIAFLLAIILSLVLHEIGHAWVSKRYSCKVNAIILLPVGGVAEMNEVPEKPAEEIMMALAGMIVNILIVLVIYFIIFYETGLPRLHEIALINSENFFLNLLIANLLLVVLNLIPALPMDGGRVLLALLMIKHSKLKAMQITATVGQIIAIGIIVTGLFYSAFLVFIGFFIFLGSQMESQIETKQFLHQYQLKDILITRYFTLQAGDKLLKAVEELINTQATSFIVFDANAIVGTLNRTEIIKAIKLAGEQSLIRDAMNPNFEIIDADQPIEDIYNTIHRNKLTLYPVKKNGSLIGVIDMENISELMMINEAELNYNRKIANQFE